MSIGILVFLGIFFPKVALVGDTLAIIMTLGTLSFLVTTPEVWVPNLGGDEFGFPLLSGAGRLVIKDIVILAGAVVLLSDSSQRVLKTLKKADSVRYGHLLLPGYDAKQIYSSCVIIAEYKSLMKGSYETI